MKSENDFIVAVKEADCKRILVEPRQHTDCISINDGKSVVMILKYRLYFSAKTPNGQKIIYCKEFADLRLFEGNIDPSYFGKENRRNMIKLMLRGEKEASYLRLKLPKISVDLDKKDGKFFNQGTLGMLHQEAKEN